MKNDYAIDGNVVNIYITRKDGSRLTTMIDLEDIDKALEYKGTWGVNKIKTTNAFYVYGESSHQGKRDRFSLHECVKGKKEGYYIDHINHNTLDNRKQNLRHATNNQNQQNRKGPTNRSISGYRNVYFDKRANKWYTEIQLDNKNIMGGYFKDVHEAGKAAVELRAKYFPFSTDATFNATGLYTLTQQ